MSLRQRAQRVLAWSLLAAALPLAAALAVEPAAGGVRLIDALERVPVAVSGEVKKAAQLDLHGHSARLEIETALVGPLRPGRVLWIAWEELSPSRPPRFRDGDRILVALDSLPGVSLWLDRIPDWEMRSNTLLVAMRGDAFLRNPSAGSVNLLAHYLALPRDEKLGAAGAGLLARLAADGELPLAISSIERIARISQLDARLEPPSAQALVRALLRPDADDRLRSALLNLIGDRRLESLRPALEQRTGDPELAPAIVFAALGQLDGSLPASTTRALGSKSPPEYRAAAARYASGPEAEKQLAITLSRDPSPEVRVAALERLITLAGGRVPEAALIALGDPHPIVRSTAIRELGSLGPDVIAELRDVVNEGQNLAAARSAVAALVLTRTPEAKTVLAEIADDHSDPGVRSLAAIALGRDVGAQH